MGIDRSCLRSGTVVKMASSRARTLSTGLFAQYTCPLKLTEARGAPSPCCSGCREERSHSHTPGQDGVGGVSLSGSDSSPPALIAPAFSSCPHRAAFLLLSAFLSPSASPPPFLPSPHLLASMERFCRPPRPRPHASWPPEAAEGGATQARLLWGSLSHKKVICCRPPMALGARGGEIGHLPQKAH